MNTYKSIFFFVVMCFILVSCKPELTQVSPLVNYIEQTISNQKEKSKTDFFTALNNKSIKSSLIDSLVTTKKFNYLYQDTNILWHNGYYLNEKAISLINILNEAPSYGFDSNWYSLSELKFLRDTLIKKQANSNFLLESEILFSEAALKFFTHLKYGFIDFNNEDSLFYTFNFDSLKEKDIKTILEGIRGEKDLNWVTENLEPTFFEYKHLRKGLKKFLDSHDISKKYTEVESLKEDSLLAYKNARNALLTYQYINPKDTLTNNNFIDKLKEFQIEHGLSADGRIGRSTAYALSRSNEDRYLSAVASLEKLRHKRLDTTSLFYVNIPSYVMKVVEENKVVDTFIIVVGKTINQTPIFSAFMTYLILNPNWHIPYSISSKEILPELKKDASIANKKGYKIYDNNKNVVDASTVDWNKVSAGSFKYKISQVRSGGTALGKVKFIFPNKYNIYFHDTPSKGLFKNDIRAYSHGCMRVKDPLELAEYILLKQDTALTLDSINRIVKYGKSERFDLDKTFYVDVDYHSTSGGENGEIIFYRDIYQKETHLKEVLKGLLISEKKKIKKV